MSSSVALCIPQALTLRSSCCCKLLFSISARDSKLFSFSACFICHNPATLPFSQNLSKMRHHLALIRTSCRRSAWNNGCSCNRVTRYKSHGWVHFQMVHLCAPCALPHFTCRHSCRSGGSCFNDAQALLEGSCTRRCCCCFCLRSCMTSNVHK